MSKKFKMQLEKSSYGYWLQGNVIFTITLTNYLTSKNRSTEGCSKLKIPKTRQVQERLVSTLKHLQVPKWDRTRCPEEQASFVGMPYPLQMFYGNL